MANEYYIGAGLPAQDNDDARGTNAFYITAGLVAIDYTPAAVGAVDDSRGMKRGEERGENRGMSRIT